MRYNVCVVGGTGFIGGHLVARLVTMGHAVRLPTRRVEASKALGVLPGVELVERDVHDPRALERVIAGSDVVINLVGILHGERGTPYGRAFARAHVELPRKIAQATSSLTFFRQIGATIGLAAMGSLMVSKFPSAFKEALPASVSKVLSPSMISQLSDPNALMSPAQQGSTHLPSTPQAAMLAKQIADAMREALAQSIHQVFVFCLIVIIAGLISVFFLKEIKLLDRKKGPATGASESQEFVELSGML